MDNCCGTCKWHGKAKNEWTCNNDESDYFTDYTGYSDCCDDWEERD